MELVLIRHGETEFNRTGKFQGNVDKELNSTGREQAELLGRRLQKTPIDAIYASDLKRVMQTVEIMNAYLNARVFIRSELREINMGEWEELGPNLIAQRYPELWEQWSRHVDDIPYPGGESGAQLHERAAKVINEIIAGSFNRVVVATSGGVIKTLLSGFLGIGFEKRFGFETDNCGITVVNYDVKSDKVAIRCINDTFHLTPMV